MEPHDEVDTDFVERAATPAARIPWVLVLRGIGAGIGGLAIVVFAPSAATADDNTGLGNLLGQLVDDASGVIDPVVGPVVGPLVGPLVDGLGVSDPLGSLTNPVTDALDGLLGETIDSLPLVGDLLGTTPTGSVLAPVAGAVDGLIDGVAGTDGHGGQSGEPGDGQHGAPGSDTASDGDTTASALDARLRAWAAAITANLTLEQLAATRTVDDGMGPDLIEPARDTTRPYAPDDELLIITPTTAWTASTVVPPNLDADLYVMPFLIVLLLGFFTLTRSRAPPRLAYGIGSTPD